MFRDEIRVSMGLTHPNIATLHDFGEENGQPYIVMEWVDGKDLRQHISRLNDFGQPIPVDLAALIISEAASGLHYAHTFRDKATGSALNIVHRDISPRNILISYDGIVKVIDFGIAKATSNLDVTNSGMIKGKPSYLAPEQLSKVPVDRRCDIFSLGTVLWELLIGKKLFAGPDDFGTIKQIENCDTHVQPPSALRPDIPKTLDEIVLKALKKNPDDRYSSAEEFQMALLHFAQEIRPDIHVRNIARLTKELFLEEIEDDSEILQRLNRSAEDLIRISQEIVRNSEAMSNPPTSNPEIAQSAPAQPEFSKLRPTPSVKHTASHSIGAQLPHLKPVQVSAPLSRHTVSRSLPTKQSFHAQKKRLAHKHGNPLGTYFVAIAALGALGLFYANYSNQWAGHARDLFTKTFLMAESFWKNYSDTPVAALTPPPQPENPVAIKPTSVPLPLATKAIPVPPAQKLAEAIPVRADAKAKKRDEPFEHEEQEDSPEEAAPKMRSTRPSTSHSKTVVSANSRGTSEKPKRRLTAAAPVSAQPKQHLTISKPKAPEPRTRKPAAIEAKPVTKIPTENRSEARLNFKMNPLSNGMLPANSREITLRFYKNNQPISIALVDFIRYVDSTNGTQVDLTNIFQFQKDGSLTAPGTAFLPLIADTNGRKTISIQAMDPQGNGLEGSLTFKIKK